MMLLLDSQTVLWALTDSPRLGPNARERLATASHVYVSSATLLEFTIKRMLGRLQLPGGLPELLKANGYRELAITHADADGLEGLPELIQHDPFGRIIASQAARSDMTLLTSDRVLLRLGRSNIVDSTV